MHLENLIENYIPEIIALLYISSGIRGDIGSFLTWKNACFSMQEASGLITDISNLSWWLVFGTNIHKRIRNVYISLVLREFYIDAETGETGDPFVVPFLIPMDIN
ncbi:hypothetical protein H8356DRAFT_1337434 [Neocallimastix lanati (nom. inval.)]|nr:hypothetical protein H8356DRAFT_1337434 [Neocallimastix sp. JGI-2020a]